MANCFRKWNLQCNLSLCFNSKMTAMRSRAAWHVLIRHSTIDKELHDLNKRASCVQQAVSAAALGHNAEDRAQALRTQHG
jgi:hypothetical protein